MERISDGELVARLGELLGEERRLTAAVLVHLGEVEARRLYLPAACSSMFVYCTRVLGMSEDQAFKRIRAARAVRKFPAVEAAVAEGRLHLSGVVLLSAHLTDENVDERVAEASGRSKAEIEVLVARWAPRVDVPERLEPVAEQADLVAPGLAGLVAPGPSPRVAARVAPLAPAKFELQLTIGEGTRSKLLRAQALLRHQVPSGDLAEVLDRALDALLEKVEARKFGRVKAPRAGTVKAPRAGTGTTPRAGTGKAPRAGTGKAPRAGTPKASRYVPREVQRQVVERDGARCSFVAVDGRRCEETGFLEFDHVLSVARGGVASVEGMRVLCRTHNQYEAERILGCAAVEAGRAAKAMDDDLVAGLRRMGVTGASRCGESFAALRGWALRVGVGRGNRPALTSGGPRLGCPEAAVQRDV